MHRRQPLTSYPFIRLSTLSMVLLWLVWARPAAAQSVLVLPVGTEISDTELQEIKRVVAFQRRKLQKLYGEPVRDTMYAKVFGDFGEFSEYTESCCGFLPISTAYLNERAGEVVIFKNEEFIKAFGHELCHALTSKKQIKNHPWLDEGLADVLSAQEIRPNGEVRERLIYYTDKLKAINTPKIRKLMKLTRAEWRSMSTADTYAMAWAVVKYLDAEDPALLTSILLAVENEQMEVEKVIEEKGKGGFKGFIRSLKKYYDPSR